MQFDELCALVGALRDRVAELETKEAARAEREAEAVEVKVDHSVHWTKVSALTEEQRAAILDMMHRMGTRWASGGMAAPGLYRIGERSPEAIVSPGVRFTPPGAEQVKSWPE